MNETTTQKSASTVQDPVCGMTIDSTQAFATRTLAKETFSFCSERCVQQFDREHTGSATTGFSGKQQRLRVELPVTNLGGHHGAMRLQEQLKTLPSIARAKDNPKTNMLRVDCIYSEQCLPRQKNNCQVHLNRRRTCLVSTSHTCV